ncbi:hypothetical protein CKA32_001860 [Geitlerinema sp. FC II]|nr:hypothetical protein CKA32_001860 [Geitlerinema sp. FC II]
MFLLAHTSRKLVASRLSSRGDRLQRQLALYQSRARSMPARYAPNSSCR